MLNMFFTLNNLKIERKLTAHCTYLILQQIANFCPTNKMDQVHATTPAADENILLENIRQMNDIELFIVLEF